MSDFYYRDRELYAEQIAITSIAKKIGTPCYIYSRACLENNWKTFNAAFQGISHRICYAVKANSTLGVLRIFAQNGSGFDIVSQGELERVLKVGGDPKKIVFSGVGKTTEEITRALEVGIDCFNIESEAELDRLHKIATHFNKIARIALRMNPNIDARTHPYIATGLHENKFGIEIENIMPLCRKIKTLPSIQLIGLACHIGSQITELNPFLETIDCLLACAEQLRSENMTLEHINVGGGLGVRYQKETPPTIAEYASVLQKKLSRSPFAIHLEPGRALTADAGILVTRVDYLKTTPYKNFAIVDAAMNDLMRPALYDAWHDIIPIQQKKKGQEKRYDIVGPICESADFLGKSRLLTLEPGDLLAISQTGAYGFSMSSNYNSRPRAAEVLVDGDNLHVIRQRETINDLLARETFL